MLTQFGSGGEIGGEADRSIVEIARYRKSAIAVAIQKKRRRRVRRNLHRRQENRRVDNRCRDGSDIDSWIGLARDGVEQRHWTIAARGEGEAGDNTSAAR